MVQRFLPARRRFAAECVGMAIVALLWLTCLVLGLGGPQTRVDPWAGQASFTAVPEALTISILSPTVS